MLWPILTQGGSPFCVVHAFSLDESNEFFYFNHSKIFIQNFKACTFTSEYHLFQKNLPLDLFFNVPNLVLHQKPSQSHGNQEIMAQAFSAQDIIILQSNSAQLFFRLPLPQLILARKYGLNEYLSPFLQRGYVKNHRIRSSP